MKCCVIAVVLLFITFPDSESRGGFGFSRGGGTFRSSSGSGGRYRPPSSSSSGSSRPSSSSSSGWSRPSNPPSRPSQTLPTSVSHPWTIPKPSSGTSNHGQSSSGWQTSSSGAGKPPTNGANASPTNQYGWKTPNAPTTSNQGQTSSSGAGKPPANQGSGAPATNQYGWKAPSAPPTNQNGWKSPNAPSVTQRPIGWQQPSQKPPIANHPSTPKPYGWQQPTQKPAPSKPYGQQPSTNAQPVKASSPVRPPIASNQNNRDSQQQKYNTGANPPAAGKKYEKGFSKGYDQGYQRGLQQGKISPAYYPQNNHFGYPGQGIYGGSAGPSYSGMHVYGAPNHYGYPVSSSYGYNTYGTGNNHDLLKGVLLGAAGVTLFHTLTSALRPSYHSFPGSSLSTHSNPWGYSGSGYGSDYNYVRVDKSVNNYYFFNESRNDNSANVGQNATPEGWIQCVAYDPIARETLTNPNCSCTVSVTTDQATNTSTAVHNCQTSSGHTVTESTPISESEVFDLQAAAEKTSNPEKLKMVEIEKNRIEAYHQLELLVNMGHFTR